MVSKLKHHLLAGSMLVGSALVGGIGVAPTAALATVIGPCPAVGTASLGCDLIITLNNNGTASLANGPSHGLAGGTYDGSDDTLVGIVNNSGGSVNSIKLTSKLNIGGFDGDGINVNPNPVSGLPGLNLPGSGAASCSGYCGTDSTTGNFNLAGPLNSFSNNLVTSIVVHFGTGLVNGGSAFFSLEEPLTAASFTTTVVGTPEPGTLAVLGMALAGFGIVRRRRKS